MASAGPADALSDTQASEWLDRARSGDEKAFGRLTELHRPELLAHCYRMLGSLHDAEDALQEALIRAWRGLPKFDGRSSFRTWIYRIATNTSLDSINSPSRRVLPMDHTEPSNPFDGPRQPLVESTWIEPFPDDRIGLGDGYAGPESKYEMRESVELAFVAALQLLPPNQRAVLILRDVLGFSAKETAETLEVTEASITSALQRARKTLEDRTPEQSQQETIRSLGDDRLRELVESYVGAMERGDVGAVVGMLTEDAAWSMPPLASWYRGPEVRDFLRQGPMSGRFRWRHVATTANGQAAVGCYTWHEDESAYLPFCIDVLTLDGDRIAEVTAFIVKTLDRPEGKDFENWPDEAADDERLQAMVAGFGLPDRLT